MQRGEYAMTLCVVLPIEEIKIIIFSHVQYDCNCRECGDQQIYVNLALVKIWF